MAFKQKSSPLNQFGFTSGIIGGMINNSSLGQQWAAKNGTPIPPSNIDPKTQAMMNVASQPLFGAGSVASNMAKQAVGSDAVTSAMGGLVSGLQNPTGRRNTTSLSGVSPAVAGPGNFTTGLSRFTTPQTNMNTRPQTPINPKALGNNTRTIANMYGRSMPGSFNRNMGPLAQMADPLTGQVIDPTMDQSTAGMNPVVQGDTAIAPPAGVEVPITPIYDINQ